MHNARSAILAGRNVGDITSAAPYWPAGVGLDLYSQCGTGGPEGNGYNTSSAILAGWRGAGFVCLVRDWGPERSACKARSAILASWRGAGFLFLVWDQGAGAQHHGGWPERRGHKS